MKKFEIPEAKVVRFDQKDIIVTSGCYCVDCPDGCPEGSDNCQCVDFPWANQ